MTITCGGHSQHHPGCPGCRRNSAAYYRRRRRMVSEGTWLSPVPAETVRDHIQHLRDAGMSMTGIARAAHISVHTLYSVVYNARKTVQGPTASAILGIQPAVTVPSGYVSAVGVARRVRALVAHGYTLSEIARRLDKQLQMVWTWASGRQSCVSEQTHHAVAVLFDQLRDVPGPSAQARGMGARNNWAPPQVWDNDIDDPGADPFAEPVAPFVDPVVVERALEGEHISLDALTRHHAVHVGLARGMSETAVARHLRMSGTTVRDLAQKPLPDSAYQLAA